MRYVQATNFGVGFITHQDHTDGLSFSSHPNDIWYVDGLDATIDAWITRVSGTEKTLAEAEALEFAVTKYQYTLKEFFKDVLTSAEVKFLMDNWSAPSITAFWNRLLDSADQGIDVSRDDFQTFLSNLVTAGYLTQNRMDEITAGRTA